MPEYYSDQLRAAVKILDTHKLLSEELLQRLVRRENLTATRLQQHIEAWYSAKARGRTESCPSEMNEPLDLSAYQRLCHTVRSEERRVGKESSDRETSGQDTKN